MTTKPERTPAQVAEDCAREAYLALGELAANIDGDAHYLKVCAAFALAIKARAWATLARARTMNTASVDRFLDDLRREFEASR